MTVVFLPELLATLVTGWTAEGAAELGIHRLHIMGIAAVVTIYLVGFFVQAYHPRQRIAAMWGAFALISFVAAGTLWYGVGRPEEVLPFFLLTGVALITHPAGRRLFKPGSRYSPALLAMVAVAIIPLLAFAANQLSLSTSTIDPHALDGHYVMMAALVFAPLAYGIVAAVGFPGWRLAAWLASLPLAYFGLLALAFPEQSSAIAAPWAIAAISWAILFVAIVEYARINAQHSLILRKRSKKQEGPTVS